MKKEIICLLKKLPSGFFVLFSSTLFGNDMPSGPQVQSGNIIIDSSETNHLKINQKTNKSVINWNSFSIHEKGRVDFNMPSSSSSSLNRVVGSTPSTISGKLNSNGNVFLINPNGVIISKSGVVNTNTFTASSLDLSNEDFLSNIYKFNAKPLSKGVENKGSIIVNSGGNAALLGRHVKNSGIVKAKLGKIALGAGDSVTLNFKNNRMMNIIVPSQNLDKVTDIYGRTLKYLISNNGELKAQGGIIELSAKVAKHLRMGTISNGDKASITAMSYDKKSGKITLNSQNGSQYHGGKIDVSSENSNMPAGFVSIKGDNIHSKGIIKANGFNGGKVELLSKKLLINNSTIEANGFEKGGEIIVMSEDTLFSPGKSKLIAKGDHTGGSIKYKGKLVNLTSGSFDVDSELGNGGLIDVEGKNIALLNAKLSAKGKTMGGKIRVGGEFQGGKRQDYTSDNEHFGFVNRFGKLPKISTAQKTYVDKYSTIDISSKNGSAGTAVIWSEEVTDYHGSIQANGHFSKDEQKFKNGGFVEISSKENLRTVDLTNTYVKGGHLLLDPKNITISSNTSDGLVAQKYSGYFADNFDNFTSTESDAKFDSVFFTSINTTTPGTNFDDTYSVQWRGFFLSRTAGSYGFQTTSDDSSWLWTEPLDGSIGSVTDLISYRSSSNEVVDNSGIHGPTSKTGTKTFSSYEYNPILIYFGENAGGDQITVNFQRPSGSYSDDGSGWYFSAGDEFSSASTDLSSFTGSEITSSALGSYNSSSTTDLDNNIIEAMLAEGTDITLQANTDITLNGAISVPTSNSSTLTLLAGRSITLNQNITTNNGNLALRANTDSALGTIDAQRDSGAASITNNATIDVGSGNLTFDMDDGVGLTNTEQGDIVMGTVSSADDIVVTTHGTPTTGTLSAGSLTASKSDTSAISIEAYDVGTITSLTASNGNWKIYRLRSDTDDDFSNIPSAGFIQYGYSDGDSVLGTGNGILTGYDPGNITKSYANISGESYTVNKTYDSTTSTDTATFGTATTTSANGLSSNISLTLSSPTLTYDDADFNDNSKTVTASSAYTISSATHSTHGTVYGLTGGTQSISNARISKAVLSSSGSRTYDATTTAAAADQTLSGLQNSETLTLSGSGTVTSADVGTSKTITVGSLALSDGTGTASNYTLTGGTHTLTITAQTSTESDNSSLSQIETALEAASVNGRNVELLPTTTIYKSVPIMIETTSVSTPDESLTVNPCVMQGGYCD